MVLVVGGGGGVPLHTMGNGTEGVVETTVITESNIDDNGSHDQSCDTELEDKDGSKEIFLTDIFVHKILSSHLGLRIFLQSGHYRD